jgi:hypothetical protein
MASKRKPPPKEQSVRVKDIKARKVDWLWKERIPKGQIVVNAGRPDGGKGLFATYVAADISNAGVKILYSPMEDSPEMVVRPRLEAAGANLANIRLWRFFLPGEFEALAEKVRQYEIGLVIIDPIDAHLNQGVTKTTSSIRKVTTPMQKLCEVTGVTFLINDHVIKKVSPHMHPIAAIGGASSGLPAACRMAFLFGKDPNDSDRMILAPAKHNIRSEPKALEFEQDTTELDMIGEIPLLNLQGECDFDAIKLVARTDKGSAKRGRPAAQRADAQLWLAGLLFTNGPMKRKAVLEDVKHVDGLSERTVRRAAEELPVVSSGSSAGGGVTWALPQTLFDHMTKEAKRNG